MSARVSVDYEPWVIETGKFTELYREYNFKNLGGPGSTTCINLKCRLAVENADASDSRWAWQKKRIVPFIYLVFDPYMLEQTKFCAAIFGPSDDLLKYKVLTAKVEAAATGVNFVVFDVSDGEHIVSMLMLGRPMILRLITQEGETFCDVPLYNDPTFRDEYKTLSERLLNKSKKTPQPSSSQEPSIQIWSLPPDNIGYPISLVKVDAAGELVDMFPLGSFPSRDAQQKFGLDLAKWMHVKMSDVRSAK
jgi:hypothetical protein